MLLGILFKQYNAEVCLRRIIKRFFITPLSWRSFFIDMIRFVTWVFMILQMFVIL